MSEPASPEPLIGDPARQAPDLHRGIVFQIWRSVEAWINLSEDELLYLEGAEDFDIVSQENAVPVQTKATAANITLRTDAVLDAMLNYWLVRNNHPSKQVRFRFITTSAIGAEQGNPFGDHRSGLKIWKECVSTRDITQVAKLQAFLATDNTTASHLDAKIQDSLSAPDSKLLTFLRTAPPEKVLEQLIAPMSWEVESVDEDVVRESVGLALRAYGERLRFRPQESMAALDRLFRVTAETAKKKEGRVLSRDRFRSEFSDATSKVVSVAEYAALQAGANAIQYSFLPISSDQALMTSGFSPIQRELPSLPISTIKRVSLVNEIAAELKKLGVIVIQGSSGMGKSTIAVLTAAKLEADWVWIDLQNVVSASIPQVIRGLANVFAEMPTLKNVGLDNLNFSGPDLLAVEVSLPAILRMARNRGGSVIITTQRELPHRLLHKMTLASANFRTVPRLNEDEIAEFCRLLGCATTVLVQMIAKFVQLQTSGHPRLVHARLVGLQAAEWPTPKAEDILGQPREIVEEREIARQLLDNAPSGDKELLYRLSISSGPFRREHAVAVGQADPSLAFPSDSFARLVGPWIDSLGSKYYRLSPLLHNAAADNWSPERIKMARSSLAHALLSTGNKTLLEANEILLQGILAEDEEALTNVVMGLQSVPYESMNAVADQLVWLPFIGRNPGQKVFKKNSYLNILLRFLQFRVIIEQAPDDVDAICARIDTEIAELKDESADDLRLMWTMTAVAYFKANIRPDLLVGYWAEVVTSLPRSEIYKETANDLKNNNAITPEMGSSDFKSLFLLMILARQMNSAYLVGLARAVNGLQPEVKKLILNGFEELLFPLRLAVDRSWLCELEKTERNWGAVLENFEALKVEVAYWNLPDLQMFICRAMAVIEDEYCDNASKAMDILEDADKLICGQKHLVDDQRATLLLRAKKYSDALKIWQAILPKWLTTPGSIDHTPLYACQKAGRAAGEIADWTAAIDLFRRGQGFAQQLDEPLFIVSFLADEAYAIWKSGKKILGLKRFVEAVESFELLNLAQEDEAQVHRLKKSMEQVVKWLHYDAGSLDEKDVWEPPAAVCSQIEVNEKMKEIPAAPFDLMWFFLADTELLICGAGPLFDRARARAKESKFAAVRLIVERMSLKALFLSRDFTLLVETLSSLNQAITDAKSQLLMEKAIFEPDAFVQESPSCSTEIFKDVIPAALILLAATGKPLGAYLATWEKATTLLHDKKEVGSLFATVRRVIATSGMEAVSIQQNEKETLEARVIAGVLTCADSSVPLVSMFVGQAFLFGVVNRCTMCREVENEFGIMVKKSWLRRIAFPPALVMPRVTIPLIKAACKDDSRGLRLIARIFLQARFAVSVSVPTEIIAEWQKIAAA